MITHTLKECCDHSNFLPDLHEYRHARMHMLWQSDRLCRRCGYPNEGRVHEELGKSRKVFWFAGYVGSMQRGVGITIDCSPHFPPRCSPLNSLPSLPSFDE